MRWDSRSLEDMKNTFWRDFCIPSFSLLFILSIYNFLGICSCWQGPGVDVQCYVYFCVIFWMPFTEQMITMSLRLSNILLHSHQYFTAYFIIDFVAWILSSLCFCLGLLSLWRENCFLQNKCNFFDSSNESADTAADILGEFKSKTTKEIPDFWLISPATSFLIDFSLEADLDTRSCIDWRGKWTSSWKKKN